jgi:hypothetical protein
MGLKQIAYEAYRRVNALESALVAKGIMREGEVQELYDEAMRHENEIQQKLRLEFWDKLKDGIEVEVNRFTDKPKYGTLVAKSVHPFTAICIYNKKGKVDCFSNLLDDDIAIKSEDGSWEYLKWRRSC